MQEAKQEQISGNGLNKGGGGWSGMKDKNKSQSIMAVGVSHGTLFSVESGLMKLHMPAL